MISVWRIAALLCITCQHRAECAYKGRTWSLDDAEELVRKNFGEGGMKSLGIDPTVFADWLNNVAVDGTGSCPNLTPKKFAEATAGMCSGLSTPSGGEELADPLDNTRSSWKWVTDVIKARTPDAQDINGRTPLHYAARWGFHISGQELLSMGADVEAMSSSSERPLQMAAFYDQPVVAKLLLENDADVNALTTYSKETPLHFAARGGSVQVVRLLIEHGATLDILDEDREIPLEVADGIDVEEIREVLMDAMQRRAADTIRKYRKKGDRAAVTRTVEVLGLQFEWSGVSEGRIRRMKKELLGIGKLSVEKDMTGKEAAAAILGLALLGICWICVKSASERAAARREKELIEGDVPAPAPRASKRRGAKAAKTPRRRDRPARRREQAAPAGSTRASAPAVRFAAKPASTTVTVAESAVELESESEPEPTVVAEAETAPSAPEPPADPTVEPESESESEPEPEPAPEPATEPAVAEAAPAPATAASVAESAVEPTTVAEPAPSPAEATEEKREEEDPAAAPAPPPKGYELVSSVLDHLGLDLLPVFVEQCIDDQTLRLIDADDLSDMGLDASASGAILDAIAMLVDGERARSKKVVTEDLLDGAARHQARLEETLRSHREGIARLRLTRNEIPEDLRCPLTLDLFCDPVTAADGHTYERVAIEEWYATGSRTSPTTNEPLTSTLLIPQHTMKKLVCAFMDTRRRSSVDDDDDVPPPRPAREQPPPSYADMLRADEWPSLGS